MFDIYEDTCLHPGIIADDVALKLAGETRYEEISKRLEDRAIKEYQENPEFRKKLEATTHKSRATEQAARDARDWLGAEMTRWAGEITP